MISDLPPASAPESSFLHLHGSAVALGEAGVLIRGASGAGKSSLALALVEAWRRAGDFASLVGDDRVGFRLKAGRGLLSPHELVKGMAEWRGIGLTQQDYEPGVVLTLIVELESEREHAAFPRLPGPEDFRRDFQGIANVAVLRLPARETERSVAAIATFMHKILAK